MKKNFCKNFLTLLLSYSLTLCLYGSGPGTTAANFLKIGVGPRAVGLGETYVAIADDVNTIFWNPAGLNNLQQQEATFMYNKWFEGIYQGFVGYARPVSKQTATGLSAQYLSMKEIQGYDEWDYETTAIKAQDIAIAVSYSQKICKNFNIGGNLKYINQRLDDESASTVAVDFGSLYHVTTLPLSFGLVAQNIGAKLKFVEEKGDLPRNIKFGTAVKLFNEKVTVASDINFPIDNDNYFSVGGEWWLLDLLALRAGYRSKMDLGNGLTFGVGFKINGMQVDYAFADYGIFKDTHRMSLTARFGKTVDEAIAERAKKHIEPVEMVNEIEVLPLETPEIVELPDVVGVSPIHEEPFVQKNFPEKVKEEIVEIIPGVLQKNIQPILIGAREPEIATLPPKPFVSKIEEVKKDTIIARVFFRFESDELTEETQQTLNEVVNILKRFPDNKVTIEGNTCAYGGLKINEALASRRVMAVDSYLAKNGVVKTEINEAIASRRAMAVNSYLARNGVIEARIIVKNFVYKKPIAKNDTPENRAQNRRVDVIILKIVVME
ncbi:MAG: PorV/PorQ family protein [Elusimicrobiota bacterium]